MQQKTHRPVQFEITEQTRESLGAWVNHAQLKSDQYLFPSRIDSSPHLSTRQYARIGDDWIDKATRYENGRSAIINPVKN
ncbi:MAG: hypothetical protein WAW61_16500 [Methylococcaceae bacterium]